jgi:nucleoid DNA-binding protein
MTKEKISSQEIIDLIASKASVSKRAAEEFLKVMIASVEEGLLAGETVKIKNFGTFKLQWNEPRKSVNVQTGDEIKLAGYYKVVFIPDSALREQVNEPFAHLEPVELDVDNIVVTKKNEFIEESELVQDPLRIFNEQASEIKNLLSEIQALSASSVSVITEEKVPSDTIHEEEYISEPAIEEEKISEIIQHDQVLEDTHDTNDEDDVTLIDEDKTDQQAGMQELPDNDVEKVDEIESGPSHYEDTQMFSELEATPYLENIKPIKKRRIWLWAIIILFLLTGTGTLYYLYTSDSEFSNKYSINKISENISISEMINSVSKWFAPASKPVSKPETIVIPKDTTALDSITENQPVDSLQILFDNPRVYTDFIALERFTPGSRLTILSKRYYGNKDFWVYIYEANKERISDPDNISTGTLIRIPKLDSKLIDASNPRCIEKAKELHDIYIK